MSEARDRLLSTATRLFYAEGVHTVGIDRIIAEAGVAKATFYHHFKSKDDLVVGYLTAEYGRQRTMMEGMPGAGAQRIAAIFEMFGVAAHGPGFRGCPFLNAAVEFPDPGHPVRAVVTSYRAWFRDYMKELLAQAGRPGDASGSEVLLVLRDGIAVSGGIEDVAAVVSAIDAVKALVGVPALAAP